MGLEKDEDCAAPRATRQSDLWTEYDRAASQSRLDQAYCADRAKLLLGSYRRNEANDPDAYVQSITLVLSDYPRAIVEYATDPRTGIQAQEKHRAFPPNSGEVKAFCDTELKRCRLMEQPGRKYQKREYVPPPSFPGCRAQVLISLQHPQYSPYVSWSQSDDADSRDWRPDEASRGIWVALNVVDQFSSIAARSTWKPPSSSAIRDSMKRIASREQEEADS